MSRKRKRIGKYTSFGPVGRNIGEGGIFSIRRRMKGGKRRRDNIQTVQTSAIVKSKPIIASC